MRGLLWNGALAVLTTLVVLGLCGGCAGTRTDRSGGVRKIELRAAPKVDVDDTGRLTYEGSLVSIDALARKIKKTGARRPVVLQGSAGCSVQTLMRIRGELQKRGIPNVTVAVVRTPSATVSPVE